MIQFANFIDFVSWIDISDPSGFYSFVTSILNKYGINRNNVWDSKTEKNTVETPEDLQKFLTALYESCGHLACAVALHENGFKEISCTTDYTRDAPQLISLSNNNAFNPYTWAFGNDNEFVRGCKEFISDYNETLSELSRQIIYKSVSYLLVLSKPFLLHVLGKEQDELNNYTMFGTVEEDGRREISPNGNTPYQRPIIDDNLSTDFTGSTWSKFYISLGMYSNWLSDEQKAMEYVNMYYPTNIMTIFEHNEAEFQTVR